MKYKMPDLFTQTRTRHTHTAQTHRVGVAFPEGLELLPFYENLAERQLLPFYAHFLSVTFTVLPQTHVFIGVLRVPPPPATPGMSLCDLGAMLGSRPPHPAPHRTSMLRKSLISR